MTPIIEIDSLSHPGLLVYAGLTENQLRSRRDPENALFIAESVKVISYALNAGYEPVSFLMEKRQIDGQARALLERCPGVPVYTGERELLQSLTGFALTRGVLCALRRKKQPDAEILCRDARRIAVLEGLTDSTNIGAIFRSAAALGMDGVLLSPACCDPLCRRSVRVSMGTVFQVPWAFYEGSWPLGGITMLSKAGFRIAALALNDKSVAIDDPTLAQLEKLALFLGTEGTGLLPETIENCDYTVRIPMRHGVDSLNVAAAAAVAFWQLRAQ